MKPPKSIDLNKWFRKHCFYEVHQSPMGEKWHFFWLPGYAIARIWPFWSNTQGYPWREISLESFVNEKWL